MNIKTVSVTYERKLNTGNFSSATLAVSAWADLDEEDEPQKVVDDLFDFCRDNVKTRAEPLIPKRQSIKGGNDNGNGHKPAEPAEPVDPNEPQYVPIGAN